ncbi:hypothetical protein Y032_0042g612 [Ancylostoma ceylanicum]|uniref:Uncharacterized protein n=1 Tax=Ancylostoma ceylanicum TaxID=53326 RepID=A0A016UGI1_9BILA|nr:hypothetical protein Y032_0042g612 [Ancylostoma ceylanicum]
MPDASHMTELITTSSFILHVRRKDGESRFGNAIVVQDRRQKLSSTTALLEQCDGSLETRAGACSGSCFTPVFPYRTTVALHEKKDLPRN